MRASSLVELEIDHGGLFGVKHAQSFPGSTRAFVVGLELVFHVGSEPRKMVAAVVLRDE